MAETVRIQKYCSDCGVLSRRAAESEIAAGKILVNGQTATLGQKIDPETDVVEYAGRRVLPRQKSYRYLLYHKPRGVVCTLRDEKGRRTVADEVKIPGVRVYPVGRLDLDSEGLLLLTDDGEFANRLTHPRHDISKIYEVTFASPVTDAQLRVLTAPMKMDGYQLLPIGVRTLSPDKLEITLWEGRNRQIRRMCEVAEMKITRLRRVAIGSIRLGDLPKGRWRDLSPEELKILNQPNKEKEPNA